MPELNVFSVTVSLDEYREPYNNYLTNEFNFLLCWLNWVLTRFGFKLEAVDWECGCRELTNILPVSVFLVPSCTFVYSQWDHIFKLKLIHMEPDISILFMEETDVQPTEFTFPSSVLSSGDTDEDLESGFLATLLWYLQIIVDKVFWTLVPSSQPENVISGPDNDADSNAETELSDTEYN